MHTASRLHINYILMYTTTLCECMVTKNCMRTVSHQYGPYTRQHLHHNTMIRDQRLTNEAEQVTGDWRPETTDHRPEDTGIHRSRIVIQMTRGSEPRKYRRYLADD